METVFVDGAAQRLQLRDFVADDQQLELGASLAPAHQMKRLDEPLEILVWLDVADVKDVCMAQLIALPNLLRQDCGVRLRQ